MMQYIYETHCHTDESSSCGRIPGEETAKMYRDEGYAGIVITDHFNAPTYRHSGANSWDEFIDFNLHGYLEAKKMETADFKVFHGLEMRFTKDNDNDYLVFGATEEYLRSHPFIYDFDDFDKFYEMAKKDGLLVFQAHPFRDNMTVTRPEFLDGIEVFNGNKRHDSRCDIALAWSKKFNLRMLSGSDCHEYEDFARGGIVSDVKCETMDDFMKMLIDCNYSLKYNY